MWRRIFLGQAFGLILLISLVFNTSHAIADIASLEGVFVAGEADVVGHLNRDRLALTNSTNNIRGVIAGTVQTSGQVQARTLGEENMADEINPRIRTNEGAACEFVASGLLPATTSGGTRVISIPSGTAYPRGYRINKASATARTVTGNCSGAGLTGCWEYGDLDQNGTFIYSDVAIGASVPAVASNAVRLFRASSDNTNVINVQDLRKLSCANGPFSGITDASSEASLDDLLKNGRPLKASNDIGWVQGAQVSWDTVTQFKVLRGSAYINGKYRANTGETTVTTGNDDPTVGTSGLDTGSIAANTKYNVFLAADQDAVKTFSITYTSGATPTGVTNYKRIGTITTDGSSRFQSFDVISVTSIMDKETVGGWINFNGIGIVTIYKSYNVSSITDNGVGDFTITWDNDFIASSDYVVSGVANPVGGTQNLISLSSTNPTSGATRINVRNDANALTDAEINQLIAVGEKTR